MMSSKSMVVTTAVTMVLLDCTVIVNAQLTSPPLVTYRLMDGSVYQKGCLPPCLCPTIAPPALRDTFNLTRQTIGPLFTDYAVTDVAWQTVSANQTIKITGSGTYRIGGEVAVTQQLTLDLLINATSPIHFDSGIVQGGNLSLIDVVIYNTVSQCTGTMIHVRAQPLPAPPSTPYYLSKRSTYQQGCFGPCDCPVSAPESVVGTFILTPTPLASVSFFRTYAVTNVNWTVLDSTRNLHITGSGTYKIGGEFAVTQQLSLDLAIDGAAPAHLDSGLVPGGGDFPAIDIAISTDTAQCIRTVISLHARPLGDFDLDGVVSSGDIAHFQACLTGPALAQPDTTCQDADLNGDGFIDQGDFGMLQLCLTGDDAAASVSCAN